MTDFPGLLAAMRAAPLDDTPRLAAADWYDEHGEPDRAEFVRRECELARTPECTHPGFRVKRCPRCGSIARTYALFHAARRGANWTTPHPWSGLVHSSSGEFTRGFIDALTLSWADWARHGDGVYGLHPLAAVELTTPVDANVAYNARGSVVEVTHDELDAARELHRREVGASTTIVGIALRLLCGKRWPGVAFTLPPPAAEGHMAVLDTTTGAYLPAEEADPYIRRHAADARLRAALWRIPPRDTTRESVAAVVDAAIGRGDFPPGEREELVEMGLRALAPPVWR